MAAKAKTKVTAETKLTPKQKLFCEEYTVDLNATQAARRAGYSKKTANEIGCQNLAKLNIAAYITELKANRREKVLIDALWVLKRAALLADFNIRKFLKVDELGAAVYDFREATNDDWYCISEYTVDRVNKMDGEEVYTVERIKLKSHDKIKALDLVGRHVDIQAFNDDKATPPPISIDIKVTRAVRK